MKIYENTQFCSKLRYLKIDTPVLLSEYCKMQDLIPASLPGAAGAGQCTPTARTVPLWPRKARSREGSMPLIALHGEPHCSPVLNGTDGTAITVSRLAVQFSMVDCAGYAPRVLKCWRLSRRSRGPQRVRAAHRAARRASLQARPAHNMRVGVDKIDTQISHDL